MENTIIFAAAGIGKTKKLKELLSELKADMRILYLGKFEVELPFNDVIILDESTANNKLNEMLTSNSLLVIDGIHDFENLNIPSNLPVYATIQAFTKEEAQKILIENNIKVNFQKVLRLEKRHNSRAVYEKWEKFE